MDERVEREARTFDHVNKQLQVLLQLIEHIGRKPEEHACCVAVLGEHYDVSDMRQVL